MFSLRKNSNNDRKNNTKINFENWEDIVTYPEHKNKSKDLLYEEDLKKNVQLADKTKDFKALVERFTRDQRWRNKNIHKTLLEIKNQKMKWQLD